MTEDNVKEQLWLNIFIITGTCRNTLSHVRVVLTVINFFFSKNTGAFYLGFITSLKLNKKQVLLKV